MLNTLANHGYLPRGGRGISQEEWTNALVSALNFDPQVAKGLFGNAILSNTSKGAEEFDLYVSRHPTLYGILTKQRPNERPQPPRARRQSQVPPPPSPYSRLQY